MWSTGRNVLLKIAVVLAMFSAAAPAVSQQDQRLVRSPILTIDSEAFYSGSMFGLRIQDEFQNGVAVLEAENRRIEAELSAEESDLTELRKTIPAAEFRVQADAFDAKVQTIRAEQRAKLVALNQQKDDARSAFIAAATPVLEEIMSEAGAAVIVESRTVFMSARAIDVTPQAIARVDLRLGDGVSVPNGDEPEQ